jgi:hypothetical protein
MDRVTRFLTTRLKLTVNASKSAVARPQERTFLGFTFITGPTVARAIAPKAVRRFKTNVREITRRARRQRGDDDSGTGSVQAGLGQLFRLLRNARGAGVPHALGPLATASRVVATVENTPPSSRPRYSRWRFVRDWPRIRPAAGSAVVPRTRQGPLGGAVQCLLRLARPFPIDRRCVAQPTRTAVYGPVRTVVWRGSAGDRRPYADLTA